MKMDQHLIQIERAIPGVYPEPPPDEPREPFPWLSVGAVAVVVLVVVLIMKRE